MLCSYPINSATFRELTALSTSIVRFSSKTPSLLAKEERKRRSVSRMLLLALLECLDYDCANIWADLSCMCTWCHWQATFCRRWIWKRSGWFVLTMWSLSCSRFLSSLALHRWRCDFMSRLACLRSSYRGPDLGQPASRQFVHITSLRLHRSANISSH